LAMLNLSPHPSREATARRMGHPEIRGAAWCRCGGNRGLRRRIFRGLGRLGGFANFRGAVFVRRRSECWRGGSLRRGRIWGSGRRGLPEFGCVLVACRTRFALVAFAVRAASEKRWQSHRTPQWARCGCLSEGAARWVAAGGALRHVVRGWARRRSFVASLLRMTAKGGCALDSEAGRSGWFSMGEIYGKGLNTEDTERKTEGTEALWRRTRFGGRWL
jgi:hypothetical protein